MARKRMLQTFREAEQRGPYDEYPVLPQDVDPQLHLSRNDRPQPFHLVCEKDTVLVQMSGRGRVEFRDSSVRWFTATPGDFIYVPGGTPHRFLPDGVAAQYRYKAAVAGREEVRWYCEACDGLLASDSWDTAVELPQEGYLRATRAFNADAAVRTCADCGAEHPMVDLTPYRWGEIAAEIRGEAESAD